MSEHKCQTYGEQFDSALKCETPEEAEHWMEDEVQHCVENHGKTVEEAVSIIKSNIGYMAGYYDDATAQKIHALFGAVHPIFGTSTYHKDMSTEQHLEMGKNAAKKDAP